MFSQLLASCWNFDALFSCFCCVPRLLREEREEGNTTGTTADSAQVYKTNRRELRVELLPRTLYGVRKSYGRAGKKKRFPRAGRARQTLAIPLSRLSRSCLSSFAMQHTGDSHPPTSSKSLLRYINSISSNSSYSSSHSSLFSYSSFSSIQSVL